MITCLFWACPGNMKTYVLDSSIQSQICNSMKAFRLTISV